jgi:hypothetical protein
MDRSEGFQVLTLWFVVMTFLSTAESGHPAMAGIAFIAIPLMYLLPVYLLVGIARKFVGE